jgi:hypothetical protein
MWVGGGLLLTGDLPQAFLFPIGRSTSFGFLSRANGLHIVLKASGCFPDIVHGARQKRLGSEESGKPHALGDLRSQPGDFL